MGGKLQRPYTELDELEQTTRVNTLLNASTHCLYSLEKESRDNTRANRKIPELTVHTQRTPALHLRFRQLPRK
jgi:hypothetical protein